MMAHIGSLPAWQVPAGKRRLSAAATSEPSDPDTLVGQTAPSNPAVVEGAEVLQWARTRNRQLQNLVWDCPWNEEALRAWRQFSKVVHSLDACQVYRGQIDKAIVKWYLPQHEWLIDRIWRDSERCKQNSNGC